MDVKRAYFIENIEHTTYRLFVSFNIFNLVFHIVKIIGCMLWIFNYWSNPQPLIASVGIMNDIWVIALAALLLFTGIRFLLNTSKNHVEGYESHKN